MISRFYTFSEMFFSNMVFGLPIFLLSCREAAIIAGLVQTKAVQDAGAFTKRWNSLHTHTRTQISTKLGYKKLKGPSIFDIEIVLTVINRKDLSTKVSI